MAKIWRPFTQHQTATEPIPIKSGEGAVLVAEDGSQYLDLTSSWWVTTHGHTEPTIARAIAKQAQVLEHNIAADSVNEPAKRLAQRLGDALSRTDGTNQSGTKGVKAKGDTPPRGGTPRDVTQGDTPPRSGTQGSSDYIFFSDNGSTAVEVALKLAWGASSPEEPPSPELQGRFIAFEGGYHGDTLGAMSAGFSSGFYGRFKNLKLNNFAFAPFPATWQGDNQRAQKEKQALDSLTRLLEAKQPVAVIFEPLVQGAAGMRFTTAEFTDKAVALAKQSGAWVIFDEVMTGFGRLGKLFAQDLLTQKPHITCLAKGLSGGFLPMGATAVSKELFTKFLGEDFSTAFAHGHSYTANPIAAAAANASLDIFAQNKVWQQIATINRIHRHYLEKAKTLGAIKPRQLGVIAAFEWGDTKAYGTKQSIRLKQAFLRQGLLLRPLGNTIYLMPPYNIQPEQLEQGWHKILKTLTEL